IEAVVQWTFQNTAVSAIRYDFDRANRSSQKLVESLGGVCVGEEPTPQTDGGVLNTLIYIIRKPSKG
ncbi:MAG: hypothetical protein EBZ48_12165, partial [Proteobacteria bacterium]|nr:hypothetical protein [Pseudomonadota bacterium]